MRLAIPALCCALLFALPASAQQASIAGADSGSNALGRIPCAANSGMSMQQCPFEVFGKSDGKATVRVLLPTQEVRIIYFENGVPVSTSATAAMSSEKNGAVTMIFIDPSEVYEIPDAVLSGS